MIAVVFEVLPKPGCRQAYLTTAAALRPLLERSDGFISVERFESLTQPGKILSLSFWRDEKAVARWRRVEEHRAAQVAGRGSLFADYRLRVAHVLRDYGMHERAQAPEDSLAFHRASAQQKSKTPRKTGAFGVSAARAGDRRRLRAGATPALPFKDRVGTSPR